MRHIVGLILTGALAFSAEIPQDGLKAEMAGEWNKAVSIYSRILKKDSTRTDLYVRISNIYTKQKQFDKAVDVLKRAIAVNSKDANLYDRLASVYAVLNQPESALVARDKTLELEPNNISFLMAHARVANWLKKSTIATVDLKKALILDPKNKDVLLLLAQTDEWAQKDADAIIQYKKYLDQNPENLKIWLALADLQSLQGDIAGSNATLKKAYARFVKTEIPIKSISSRVIANGSVPILEYHCVSDVAPNMYWVSTSDFKAQMDELVKNGYHSVTMDTITKAMKGGAPLPNKPIAITFDDGCENIYTKAFPILKERGLNAEIYIITDSMGNSAAERKSSATAKLGENGESSLNYYLTWTEVKEMSEAGWGIGSHSRTHPYMSAIDDANLTQEILYSKLAILENIGVNPISFSYPYGDGNWKNSIHKELTDDGYMTAVASAGGVAQLNGSDSFNIPRILIYGPKPLLDPQSKGVSVVKDLTRPNDQFIAKIKPNDAEEAYQKANYLDETKKYSEAFASINKAVELAPDTVRYLNEQLSLAGSVQDSFVSAETAFKIYKLQPTDEHLLSLAQAYQWDNRLNDSADYYKKYLEHHPEQKEVWIEYINIKIWLGQYASALESLDYYKGKFGIDTPYLQAKADALAWGNRPRNAFTVLDSTLKNKPNDYKANYTKTVALKNNLQPIEAVENLKKVEEIGPENIKDNTFLRKYITTSLRPSVTAGLKYYSDTNNISDVTTTLSGEYYLTPASELDAAVRLDILHAKDGSGYEQDNGKESAYYKSTMIGYGSQISQNFSYHAAIGGAEAENRSDLIYKINALWSPINIFSLNMAYGRDFYVVSPRTVARAIKDDNAAITMHWEPTMKVSVDVNSQYDWLSDGNKGWVIDIAPKVLVARTQYWNLDLGPSFNFSGFDRQYTDHGYYAPKLVQEYFATGYLYWKKSDNDGVSLVASAGVIDDSYENTVKPAFSTTLEGTFGIYQDWMLKAAFSIDHNSRYTSEAYTGTSYSLFLTRRF